MMAGISMRSLRQMSSAVRVIVKRFASDELLTGASRQMLAVPASRAGLAYRILMAEHVRPVAERPDMPESLLELHRGKPAASQGLLHR